MSDPCPHCGVDVNDLTAEIERLKLELKIKVVSLSPGDRLVLFVPGEISEHVAGLLKSHAETMWPGHQIAVLGDNITLGIIRAADQPTAVNPETVRD